MFNLYRRHVPSILLWLDLYTQPNNCSEVRNILTLLLKNISSPNKGSLLTHVFSTGVKSKHANYPLVIPFPKEC